MTRSGLETESYPSGGRTLTTGKKIAIFVGTVATASLLILLLVFLVPRKDTCSDNNNNNTPIVSNKPLNVIVFVPDGFGPSGATLGRVMKQLTTGKPTGALNFDPYLTGTIQTKSSNSLITDSAAAASAYSTGFKCANGAMGVNDKSEPIGTMFEAAKTKGMKTGVVVTTRISDATPGGFYSHTVSRGYEDFIISQFINRNMSVALGGGKKYFNATVMEKANKMYNVVYDKDAMNKVTTGNILGLFADADLPYEIDRLNNQNYSKIPSLAEMTAKGLELISQNNDKGFIMLVEGSKIDLAGHDNDAFAHWQETLAFDNAFQVVLDFANKDNNTVLVMMADHETGGLTLGLQPNNMVGAIYEFFPDFLLSNNGSAQTIAKAILSMKNLNSTTTPTIVQAINSAVNSYYKPGNWDTNPNTTFTTAELDHLSALYVKADSSLLSEYIGRYMSVRAKIGWTTGGHTGTDINLYNHYTGNTTFVQMNMLKGNHDNTDISRYLATILGLDLAAETAKLAGTPVKP
ncbi:hypothetical protein SAMD00019534_118400 [Acytostelium subglobosum LB1]|uniref:hypothetical protein n=1 Tax=Acytostelium subglobosum LB1 TaxID=1410327 RepID=UPI000644B66F|nr:hypothetical protein SAMD00019534_118400 [Acytostelium subglobosum LB1]GAM28664.1 hypothetical protein SAMD00019534_118400 [Acytostelium subglobosum LB1]|eukprot:XP_012748442.1 hypothetical protein SAMD00019534_118400 [Acytostelium subglobosum LB1]